MEQRAINDRLRKLVPTLPLPHKLRLTSSVCDLPEKDQSRLFAAVRSYDDFSEGNDPWQEHDFGVISIAGATYYWKFDYGEDGMRLLTIMAADEY